MSQVRAGAQAPECFRLEVDNAPLAADPFDFTTATGFVLKVRKPNGERVEWSTTTITQTADTLVLEHVFAALDVEQPGAYQIDLDMTVAGGVRRAGPTTLNVVE